ncbi:MAG: hypothetical protein AABW84_01370 [Nanoarchaeota archaeon]
MNKRGTWLVYLAIVFVILVGFAAIFLKNYEAKDIVLSVGERQSALLGTYKEAEAIREYARDSAATSAVQAAIAGGAGTGEQCFTNLGDISQAVKSQFDKLMELYKTPRVLVDVVAPKYDLVIDTTATKIIIEGFSKDILISSEVHRYEYTAQSYFREEVTCNVYAQYFSNLGAQI